MTIDRRTTSLASRATAFAGRAVFTLAASGAWLASAGFNAMTGQAMGQGDPVTTALWIMAAVSLDMLKGGASVKVACQKSSWHIRVIALVLMLVATVVSLIAALTMRTNSQAAVEASRQGQIQARQAVLVEIAGIAGKLNKLTALGDRAVSQIDADLANKQDHKRWRSTDRCTDATLLASKTFCNEYRALVVGRTQTKMALVLTDQMGAARARLAALPMPTDAASPVARAMVTYLAAMNIKAGTKQVADWLVIFLTVAIEFGAVAGPMLVTAGTGGPSVTHDGTASDTLTKDEHRTKGQPLGAGAGTLTQDLEFVQKQVVHRLGSVNGIMRRSYAQLADDIGTSKSTIARAAKALVRSGTIKVQTGSRGTVWQLATA